MPVHRSRRNNSFFEMIQPFPKTDHKLALENAYTYKYKNWSRRYLRFSAKLFWNIAINLYYTFAIISAFLCNQSSAELKAFHVYLSANLLAFCWFQHANEKYQKSRINYLWVLFMSHPVHVIRSICSKILLLSKKICQKVVLWDKIKSRIATSAQHSVKNYKHF